METVSGELSDFCLVLAPDGNAVARASDGLRSRFTFLAAPTTIQLVAAVAERVTRAVSRGSGLITVAISLESDGIHGKVSDSHEPPRGTSRPGSRSRHC